eukprot:CAMPEP_0119547606 /NCGR_PEP_ID=MMETSP1352-20130426/1671_1 /TAXON_ID=265584 /ORGANISM="Stauroneis constricta, Strain CCMP1120" /LENGTH=405 /DNA_ID=CAMNT_0007592559 /DNA_START=407 /DNA_END=1621 /DNA_ORIENTATION=+
MSPTPTLTSFARHHSSTVRATTAALLLILLSLQPCASFAPQSQQRQQARPHSPTARASLLPKSKIVAFHPHSMVDDGGIFDDLFHGNDGNNDGGNDDGHRDLDQVRQQLEFLISKNNLRKAASNGDAQLQHQHERDDDDSNSAAATATVESESSTPSTPEPLIMLPPRDDPYVSDVGRVSAPELDIELPPRPSIPFTTMQRRMREHEIQLLLDLQRSDDPISDLQTQIWYQERGVDAANELHSIDRLLSNSGSEGSSKKVMESAKSRLQDLIELNDIYFVEPIYKLASIAATEEDWHKAAEYYKIVLSIKPWHIHASSGIVTAYAQLQQAEQAQQWAFQRLPKTTMSRRRAEWIQRMTQLAQRQLVDDENAFISTMFGSTQDEMVWKQHVNDRSSNIDLDEMASW